jgi:hypothetical protein
VLPGKADEGVDSSSETLERGGGRSGGSGSQNVEQASFAEFLVAFVHRLDDTIGKDDQQITRRKRS